MGSVTFANTSHMSPTPLIQNKITWHLRGLAKNDNVHQQVNARGDNHQASLQIQQ